MKFFVFIVGLFLSLSAHAEGETESTSSVPPEKPLEAQVVESPVAPVTIKAPDLILANNTFQNGHNLSATSDLLAPGRCAIGIDIIACGITDSLMIGASPWMYIDYNMYAGAVRALLDEDAEGNRWGLQVNYFKTFKERAKVDEELSKANYYQMEAVWVMFIRSLNYDPHYRLHINFHANYYMDERMPFSLRRPFVNKTPYQFNFTLLHEVDLVRGWFLFGEMGLLDFARNPIHIHSGVSIGRTAETWGFHLGFSMSSTGRALFGATTREDYQQNLLSTSAQGYDQELDRANVENDFSLHPEFSLFYKF